MLILTEDKYFGWNLYYHYLFKERLDLLETHIAKLKERLSNEEFKKHPEAKKLKKVYYTITELVPLNPEDPIFLATSSLKRHKDWRRVKNSPAPKYRLFFKYFKSKTDIFYAWFNDQSSVFRHNNYR